MPAVDKLLTFMASNALEMPVFLFLRFSSPFFSMPFAFTFKHYLTVRASEPIDNPITSFDVFVSMRTEPRLHPAHFLLPSNILNIVKVTMAFAKKSVMQVESV
jgi:hypothetical protein